MEEWNGTALQPLLDAAQRQNRRVSALVLAQQAAEQEQPPQALCRQMEQRYAVMCRSVADGCAPNLKSTSGLTGGEAARLQAAVQAGRTLTGPVLSGALYRALAASGANAAMGRIVAAPTAGSCGILPAALLTMQAEHGCPGQACVEALFTAGAVGMVIAHRASLAGAQGGCQAECGSACAMAAAAIVELAGGTPRMIGDAVAIALKNMLGLVCDPVAGLVEIPCIKRNAAGVANAFVAAELALAGVGSAIPPDEVIDAMKQVGDAMPQSLKETACGGLAATPTGQALRRRVFGE